MFVQMLSQQLKSSFDYYNYTLWETNQGLAVTLGWQRFSGKSMMDGLIG